MAVGAVLSLVLLLACAAPASAAIKRVTVRQGPLAVDPYGVRFTSPKTRAIRAPGLDGYLVSMHTRVVDRRGRPMPVRRLMLHHIVYKNTSRSDPVCGGKQSFYGTGEENETLRFPPGYGYRVRRRDRWITGWMLMNHRGRRQVAYIEYTARIETRKRLRPVIPYWARVTGCRGARDPIFNVPGGGAPGSTHTETAGWTVPRSGRIVAAGSHVHGGSKEILLTQPTCEDRVLLTSRPLYGRAGHPYYNVLPVLHEPGPFATSWITTAAGIPVRRGERLRVVSLYDGERPHMRVMGIWHVYLAPGPPPANACPPMPTDVRNKLPAKPGRLEAPKVTVPLTGLDGRGRARPIRRPPGPLMRAGRRATVRVGEDTFSVRNLSIARGGRVTWRFRDGRGSHDVTLASGPFGPVGFASRWDLKSRRYSRRFDIPGTYRLYCTLHPIDMTQVLEVRPE